MALNADFQLPDEISNKAFQPKGSGQCGFFVAHWCDEAARRCLGEGPMAGGFPDPSRWLARNQGVIIQVIKNKGLSDLEVGKSQKKKEALENNKCRCWRVGEDYRKIFAVSERDRSCISVGRIQIRQMGQHRRLPQVPTF